MNFWHRFLNPHCEDCKVELEESKRCKSCESLKEQLDLALRENMKLLELLIEKHVPPKVVEAESKVFLPIQTSQFKPWREKQRELEKIERQKAEEIRKKAAQPDDPEVVALEELVLGDSK